MNTFPINGAGMSKDTNHKKHHQMNSTVDNPETSLQDASTSSYRNIEMTDRVPLHSEFAARFAKIVRAAAILRTVETENMPTSVVSHSRDLMVSFRVDVWSDDRSDGEFEIVVFAGQDRQPLVSDAVREGPDTLLEIALLIQLAEEEYNRRVYRSNLIELMAERWIEGDALRTFCASAGIGESESLTVDEITAISSWICEPRVRAGSKPSPVPDEDFSTKIF